MLLLTGPAGSGKTFRILARLREALRRKDSGVRLLVPTATMAQHLQNHVAREGFVFRPGLIQTLLRFVDAFAADRPQVSEPLLYLIVEDAARRVARPEFARVVHLPGFCAALARTMEEFSAAGCDADRLARQGIAAPLGDAFLAVYGEVDRELARRGLATRSQRLLHAAERMLTQGLAGVHTIWMDGFHALPDPELAVIAAICRHADVTLTLPAAKITEGTRGRLLAMGFTEDVCRWECPPPRTEVCEAPSIEREADEIARRILVEAAAGRPFREMGIIVRSPELYQPVLRATLDRFGIPARFYFDADLSRHALARFLTGTVDAMLAGWDYAETLAAVRLAPGIISDEFDFALRRKMPGNGLAGLAPLETFQNLEEWRGISMPPVEWAARLKALRDLFQPGRPEPANYDIAAAGRGQANVLDLFDGALDEAANSLPARPVALAGFWRAAKSVIRLTPLRIEDRRRNVVQVMGAHEARQWRLPVIFVCGLVEKQFPKLHAPDPFFPEPARVQLQRAGIRLRTAADFEAEERFLFDSAMTRATESLTLSYPRADARGQQNLPSMYLERMQPVQAQAVRPAPGRQIAATRPRTNVASQDLIEALAQHHSVFRPTALESYLQCPFQFFGRHTLKLEEAPKRPEDRLNFMVEGNIVHGVLAEFYRGGLTFDEVFERVFRQVCERERIPRSYRTEACRERLLIDLHEFVADTAGPRGVERRLEEKFQYVLIEDLEIKGRIDRVEVMPDGSAWVIDYKYSRAQNMKKRVEDENRLQPQLYAVALERCFQLPVAGLFYCSLRGGVKWTALPFTPAGQTQAIDTTLRVAGEIRAGRVAPEPADPEQCPRCDFRDVCRFQAAAVITEGTGA